jgi:gliding motility-associated-like protein
MRKILPSYIRSLLFTGLFLCLSLGSYASHIVGAELRYTWVPSACGNTYLITVYLYGDCGPASSSAFSTLPMSQPQVCIYNGASTTATATLNLPVLAPSAGLEVTPVCPDSIAYDQCSIPTSLLPGIKKFVYQTLFTFPGKSSNWRLVYDGNNPGGSGSGRAAAITNLGSGTIMQLIDTLNNNFENTRGNNSSPVLSVEPTPYFCKDLLLTSCYNPGAVDVNDTNYILEPSGDSLAFSLIDATNGTSVCGSVGGSAGYVGVEYPGGPVVSGAWPLTVVSFSPASFNFDPNTGQLCFIPLGPQRSVVVYNIAEYRNDTIGRMATYAGTGVSGFGGDGLPASAATMNRPTGICRDAAGVIYFSDYNNNRIRKIDLSGNISTIAGTGIAGYAGDGATATAARLDHPMGITVGATGNVFFADMSNHVIRRITPGGIISTVAGNGAPGFAGDGGPAAAATCQLNTPLSVFADAAGNLYISDAGNQRIRKVSPVGIIGTIAGNGLTGYDGDGGPAVSPSCYLNTPFGLHVDATGNIFFADSRNNVVRKISAGGLITTVAGTDPNPLSPVLPGPTGAAPAGFAGDGGIAASAACQLNNPTGVFVDKDRNIYIADQKNHRIRMVDSCGFIRTMVGDGLPTFSGDGAQPLSAGLDSVIFVIKDSKNNILLTDFANNRIREVVRNANINKVKVGTMQREMTFLVKDCSYTQPLGAIDTGFGGGIHRIDATHYYGCANSGTFTLNMNPHESDTSLHIIVTVSGMTTGFGFVVDSNNTNHPHAHVTGNTSVIIPGFYTFYLTYTDNHCPLTGTNTVAFSVQILPVPTITDTLVLAATCTDSAKVRVIPGGTGKPWTIKISSSVVLTDTFLIYSDTTSKLLSFVPGTYFITIFSNVSTDCAQSTVLVVDTASFMSGTTFVNPTYCGANDGYFVKHDLTPGKLDSIYFRYNGLRQLAQGTLVPASGNDTVRNLLAGVYDSIQVKEQLCVTRPPVTVTLVNPPFTYRNVTTKNPSKCGFCDGVDTVWGLHPGQLDTISYTYTSPAGVVSPFALTHLIGVDSSVIISGLCAGSYSNYVVNTAGVCNATKPGPFNLIAPGITANFDTVVHYGCNGDTIMFTNLSQPSSDLTYVWFFGDGATGTAINPKHVYLNTTSNTVTIKLNVTNTKCVATYSVTETFDNHIQSGFSMQPDQFICQDSLVTFTNTSTGTNPTYTWLFGDGTTSNAVTPTHLFANTGTYKVSLVAHENMFPIPLYYTACSDTFSRTISVDSNSSVSINVTDSVLCQGQGITFTGIFSNIGDTLVSWSFGDGSVVYNQNPIQHSFENADASTPLVVTLNVKYRSCPGNSASHQVKIYGYPNIYLGPDLAMCPGSNPLTLIDEINAPKANARWRWSTGETTPGITIVKPGTYINVVTIDGCSSSDTVVVATDCYMAVPSVFSPNGDGTNDYFYPRQELTKGLVKFSMDIYNRWGQMIYQTTSVDGRGWDGMFNDQPQPTGVYVYMIDAVYKDGQKEHHQGNVTLLR